MGLTTSALFSLASDRLAWVNAREQLLTENIANSDTPAYQARDLPRFSTTLDRVRSVVPLRSSPRDLLPASAVGAPSVASATTPTDASVNANLAKLADTEGMQSLVLNLYGAYLGMFRTALGVSGGSNG